MDDDNDDNDDMNRGQNNWKTMKGGMHALLSFEHGMSCAGQGEGLHGMHFAEDKMCGC